VNPWGQEAIRAHRLYRVLAERVVRSGGSALRFDYFGSGESAGDDSAFSLAGAQIDVGTANATLLDRVNAVRLLWIGVGLGAVVALQASRIVARAPDVMVLWDPVIDGRRYLDDLRLIHRDWLQRTYGRPFSELRHVGTDELLGFPLSAPVQAEIEAIQVATLPEPRAQRLLVLGSAGHSDAQRAVTLFRAAGHQCDYVPIATAVQWASEEAMNNALVPSDALQAVERLLKAA
jgi:hypothetical protein